MVEEKTMRLSQVARKFNVGRNTIVEFLSKKGFDIDRSPNAKIPKDQYDVLAKEFASSAMDKEEASALTIGSREENQIIDATGKHTPPEKQDEEELFIKKLEAEKASREEKQVTESTEPQEAPSPPKKEEETDSVGAPKLQGLNVLGKIDLDEVSSKKKPKPAKQKKEAKEAPKVEAEKEEASPAAKVEEVAPKEEVAPPAVQPKDEPEPSSRGI